MKTFLEHSQLEERVMINEVAFAIPLLPYAGLAINLALNGALTYLTVKTTKEIFNAPVLKKNAEALAALPAAEQSAAIDAATPFLQPDQVTNAANNLGFNAAVILALKKIWEAIVAFLSSYWWIILIALLGAGIFSPAGRRLVKKLARNANKKFKKHKKEDLKKAQRGEEI
tara:strand:- start:5543 stop:6055 length:513 start_codon:yes stop_codon:yes gene_type:complete